VTVRRIGRLGENLAALMDEKINGVYDQGTSVTKHGLQRGYKVFASGDFSGDYAAVWIDFDTTTDGVRFSSAPIVMVAYGGLSGVTQGIDGYGQLGARDNVTAHVSGVMTSGFALTLQDDKGATIAYQSSGHAAHWIAFGPVAGI